jgi:hypothetical protein
MNYYVNIAFKELKKWHHAHLKKWIYY